MEDNKIQSFTGEMVDFKPLKYNPNTPKITQADLDKKIKEKQAMQDRLRQEAQSRKMQEFESQSNSLFESSLNVTDDKLRKQYTGASRVSDVAGVIRDYAMNNGIDLSNANDNDVIQAFMKSNPNKANGINDYLNGTTDLYTASANIGFVKPQQQENSESKGGFFTNLVGGAYDSVTGLGRLIAKYGSEGIGEIAKFLGADEDKVNSLVQSYQDSLKNFSGEALGADTDSWTYKGSKFIGDMTQVAAGEGLARGAIQGSQALNALSKAAGSGPLWARAAKAGIEGAADMGLYKAVSDSELPSVGDLAEGAVLGAAFPMAGAGVKALGKAAGVKAEGLIGDLVKLSATNQKKFLKKLGVEHTKWLNDRGLKTMDDVVNYYNKSISKVDDSLAAIKGRFTSPELTEVLDDVVEFARKTESPELKDFVGLQMKNAEGGLTMSETNKVKRYFEKKRTFNYDTTTSAETRELYTNMDSKLREWQQKVAKENGLENIAELNKETMGAKYLMEKATDGMKTKGGIPFTDLLIAITRGNLKEASQFLVGKSLATSPTFKKYGVNIMNRLAGHKTVDEIIVDFEAINKINNEKELKKLLDKWAIKDPQLPYYGDLPNVNTIITEGENIVGTEGGKAFRQGQIAEI